MIKFIGAFDTFESIPKMTNAEYAFLGRSNVGKSSLLNAVCGQKIARTSNTPGRTQTINLFETLSCPKSGNCIILADLPGYGYARASKSDVARWQARTEKYLSKRDNLKLLFILIDSRHGPKPSDLEIMNFCDANAIGYALILTKSDKAKKTEIENAHKCAADEVSKRGAAMPQIFITSSEKRHGIDALRDIMGL